MKKIVAMLVASAFMAGTISACTPTQVSTAKDVFAKV